MTQTAWSDRWMERVVQQVSNRTGLYFREAQRETVEAGIHSAMSRAKVASLAEYLSHIERHAAVFDDLLVELTVGETYFFRDTEQMAFIRRELLPEIVGRCGWGKSARIWSAGCASGEEAYSLAMLAADAGFFERVGILATDISRRSLEKAQQAIYGEWSLRGDGAITARKYLHRNESQYQLDPSIRSRVRFEYLNLALDVYPSAVTGTRELDLILCRNVLIYFDRETIASVARRFFDSLSPGGWLITAAGDPSLEAYAPFEMMPTTAGLFYRRGLTAQGLSVPSTGLSVPSTGLSVSSMGKPVPSMGKPGRAAAEACPRLTMAVVHEPSVSREPVVPLVVPPVVETLAKAQQALAEGNYATAAAIAERLPDTADSAAVRVQALANSDLPHAEQVCAAAVKRHVLSAQLAYLHSVLLLDLDREYDAAHAARRAVYLDSSLAIAHFMLGSVLRRLGDVEAAKRSFRNVKELCDARPGDEIVRFSDCEHAAVLSSAAWVQLEGLNR